ncbi:MAG: Thiol-disulfide isomerase [Myxococcaceae bacterium]|nr:Thiol-disulfide isomerase [Myxococcaceae bacterium]
MLAFGAASAAAAPPAAVPVAAPASGSRTAEDLARARVLDQQGAKAYGDGRYNDAIRYFEESHRLGGPPFELWNIAKCYARLDQPEQAAEMLERYLATPTLPADDREEATQQLDALRRRTSTVTLASQPTGATVTLDGRPPPEGGGKTPTSFTVPPGQHTITLTAPKRAPYTQAFEARYGRAIILDVKLKEDGERAGPATNPYGDEEVRRVALRGDVGVMLPRYGSVGGAAHATLTASGTYRFADVGATTFAVGGMLLLTGDSWDNTVAAPTTAAPCGTLRNPRSDTALSMFVMGTAGWEIVPRLRVHALAGVGLAAIFADDLGGDVFVSACKPSPGPRPALMFGGQLDYALTPLVRLSALPLVLQLQPAFEGTRSIPIDTSGVWMRATIAIGAGVDL